MKKLVLKTAKEMGYISNTYASALRSGKTNTIGIIVPDISNPHLAYQIMLIEDALRSKSYSIIIMNTNEDEDEERKAIELAVGKQVDGILLCPTQKSDKNIIFLNKLEIPYLLIGRYFDSLDSDYVCADDIRGGYILGKYLYKKGYRNPIYIGAYKYIEASSKRFLGLCDAFSEEGIALSDDVFFEISPKRSSGRELIKKYYWKIRILIQLLRFLTYWHLKLFLF